MMDLLIRNPAPSADALARQLPDIGQGLACALADLQRSPDPDRCETLAIRLSAAARLVLSLRAAVLTEAKSR